VNTSSILLYHNHKAQGKHVLYFFCTQKKKKLLRKRDNVLHNYGIIKILINMYHITMKFKDAIASCDASQTDLHGLVQVSIEIQQSGVA